MHEGGGEFDVYVAVWGSFGQGFDVILAGDLGARNMIILKYRQ